MDRQGPQPLSDQVVLITGGGHRLGAALVRGAAAQGASIALHYRHSGSEAQAIADEVKAAGGNVATFAADLADAGAPERLVDQVLHRFGRLDHLVSSSAVFERTPFETMTESQWDSTMALNVRASAFLAQRAAAALRAARGSIVLITCASVTLPYPNYLPYIVSKAAAKQLMRALAIELAPEVRVNAVAPGTVLAPASMDEAEVAALGDRTLVRRVGTSEDVVDAVMYLLQASFVTGVELLVDGGVTLGGQWSGER